MKRRHFLFMTVTTTGLSFAASRTGRSQIQDLRTHQSSQTFPTTTSFFVEHDEARLYVESEGEGNPVLLLHGGLGYMGWFAELRSHLSQRYQVILVDTRGCGRSAMGPNGISYGQQERDVQAILAWMGIQQCAVIGFSDGGIVGMRLAARPNSPVSQLVTIGSRWLAAHSQGMWQEFNSWSRDSLSAGPFSFIVEDYDQLKS